MRTCISLTVNCPRDLRGVTAPKERRTVSKAQVERLEAQVQSLHDEVAIGHQVLGREVNLMVVGADDDNFACRFLTA